MKISIVTAVYNGARSILPTLQSLGEQNFRGIEHIVIDGNSSDSTLAVIRQNDKRGAVLLSEPDEGVYDAFNKGLRLASGDIVGFLNSGDTYLSANAISKIATAFVDRDIEAVFGDVLIVDPRNHLRVIRRYSSKYFSPARMSYGLMPAHPTLFFRQSVYDSIGQYDTRFKIAGDFELCLRAFAKRHTRYRYLAEPLVRMPAGGLSNAGWRSKLQITLEMREACRQANVPTSLLKLCLRMPLKIAEMLKT